jgi:2'-5' RNA ligase
MHRLFVALRPSFALRAQLLDLMGGVPGARWQDDDQLHLTLRFIGEVATPVAEDVAAALTTVDHPRPEIALSGVGAFASKGHIHSLWAGIAADERLHVLQKQVDRTLIQCGLAPEARAYKPHITVARLGRAAGPAGPFLERGAGLASAAITLDAFFLFESRLGHHGAAYETVARYPLR